MPRLEAYVNDRMYIKILQHKENNRFKSNGQAVNDIINRYFKMQMDQDDAIRRFTEALKTRDEKLSNLERELDYTRRQIKNPGYNIKVSNQDQEQGVKE